VLRSTGRRTGQDAGPSLGRRLAAFAGTSAVVGAVAAGMLAPAAGATAMLVRGSAGFFDSLPSRVEPVPMAQQSRVVYADGSPMATFYEQNRVVVPLSAVAPVLRQAVVAIEDSRFYEHAGVDPVSLARAVVNNLTGGDTQGASTITQQWIKNVLAEDALRRGGQDAYEETVAKDYGRKIREIKLATAAERSLSKDQILESYLNIALFGDGQYGIETAARHFVGKSAADLNLPEAALLAGMIRSPRAYDPVEHPEAAMERRDVVLARMLELGLIDRAQHDEAVAVPLEGVLRVQESPNGCTQAGSAAFFCDYVLRSVLGDPAFGKTPEQRRQLLYRGGLTVTTTLERPRQDAAAAAVAGAAAPTDGGAAALVSVQAATGRVVAMAQSRPYDPRRDQKGHTAINYAVDASMGGSSGFQVGSAFKPFTLATWLAAGRTLDTKVPAPETESIDYAQLQASCARLVSDQPWPVGNSEGHGGGETTVLEGTFLSINTAYANMLRQLDLCAIYGTASALGVHRADGAPMPVYPSFILGTEEIAPLTMASAYAAFARSGVWCAPVAVAEVKDAAGKVIGGQQPRCSQAIPPQVADAVAFALGATLDRGTASCCDVAWPAAGKTGTTNDSTETWFVGFTRQLSTAVWVGTPDESPGTLNGVPLNGVSRPRVYGSTVAAPAWKAYTEPAMAGQPPEGFPPPPDALVRGSPGAPLP
jgi:membrane peptidoglycan carboxypeptidase